nr:polycomb group RING finger protein 3-like isoform X2 [Cherax quadricarinatus]XP_053631639.1 polycomb group RING finger protein 3-like isoform X2 [Cherax quadricarinatus]XP_053631640.1 polycomb group RING finger protein 3-like isoform X2 [Cherax quadricarinatus]XP_053631642.1 polycomb group RING finger protein 3-like isoform X2 [Cherax quadricarinatus]
MERRIKLRTLNEHIVCAICSGYLVDATTVTECLHTFCKSCLVKHLEERNTCPTCDIVIHQSHPLNYISFDRTMQDIVCKLVPLLQEGMCIQLQHGCLWENRDPNTVSMKNFSGLHPSL